MTNPSNLPDQAHTEQSHPLVIAAQQGYGPMSPKAQTIWHGDSTPCASCGMLNLRTALQCHHCQQDLSQPMLQKMAEHSGPWFVHDPIRPIPGISLERMIKQIRRGVLTRTSIVRGPTTFYQWRYATETPLIARLLGYCWQCQAVVAEKERYCPKCKAMLAGFYRADQLSLSSDTASPDGLQEATTVAADLEELSEAVSRSAAQSTSPVLRDRARKGLGIIPVIFLGLTLLVVFIIYRYSASRDQSSQPPPTQSQPTSSTSWVPSNWPLVIS
ncbi:MAG: hypothetical protein HJJLKODD_00034 [Phycisphaerae bacterium]|nr:hypothetical protein [Phycisphaerae bacterium]